MPMAELTILANCSVTGAVTVGHLDCSNSTNDHLRHLAYWHVVAAECAAAVMHGLVSPILQKILDNQYKNIFFKFYF